MSALNIIGNGFDSYHGLPTAYYYFACYVLKNNEQLYDEMADMYGFSKGILNHATEDLERKIDDQGYWSEFEKNIAFLSPNWVENSLQDDLFLEYDDAVDLEIEKENRTADIKEILNQWVLDTVDKKSNYELIEKMLGKARRTFGDNDLFVSFNYTHTLEEIYGIHNVLHIHGEASQLFDNGLIVGHGNDDVINRMAKKIDQLELDDYDQPSRNRKIEYKFEKEILAGLRKPVGYCLSKLMVYLKNASVPDVINVYGLSLGEVDIPYLQFINEKWSYCKWKFSYYEDKDIEVIRNVADTLKLCDDQWSTFYFNNPNFKEIQEILVHNNNIIEYPTWNS